MPNKNPKTNKDIKIEKIGESGYLNKNCWLVKTLNYSPAERCRYCELKFRHCLFLQYLIISSILILFLLTLSFLIEGEISKLVIISIFVLVIIYGYFFNKNTEKIIKSYFAQRKAKEALEELAKGLEVKVEQRTKEIQKLSDFKTELLSIVAHQIKNPLTTIKGYASLVEDKTISGTEATMDVFKKIKASAGKLLTLLNNLLDFHHLEEGKLRYDFQKLELNKLLKDIVEGFQIVTQQRNLDLVFEPSSSEVYVNGDIYKLSQVFQNLIDNAIKYTEKGWVKVAVTQTNADKEFLYEDLTYKIRGVVFSVKKRLGLGHKEIIYQKSLEEEFKQLGLMFEREKPIEIIYRDKKVGIYRPDFIIENKIILEIKALPFIAKFEEKQLWNYLKGTNYKLALLVNFGRNDVYIKRVIYDSSRQHNSAFSPSESASSQPQSTLSQRESALITVSDSGRGMSQELTQKLFQKFSRGAEEIKTFGSGLGLYISKEIVSAHQGKIWAESEGEGKGSKFFVELPRIFTKDEIQS